MNKNKKLLKNLEAKMLSYTILFLIIFVTLSSVLVFVPYEDIFVKADFNEDSWSYFKNVTVTNKILGYQSKINVTKTSGGDINCSGHCNNNFSDIRFVYANDTELPYWIEEYEDGVYAIIWVNNSYNSSYFYMWYGNAAAVDNSDGNSTFDFFDDFSEGSLNTSKWTTQMGTPVQENGHLNLTNAKVFGDVLFGPYNYRFKNRCYLTGQDNIIIGTIGSAGSEDDAMSNRNSDYTGSSSWPDECNPVSERDGVQEADTQIPCLDLDSYRTYEITWTNSYAKYYQNDSLLVTHTSKFSDIQQKFWIQGYNASSTVVHDWVFVGKFRDTEPSFSFGVEESSMFILNGLDNDKITWEGEADTTVWSNTTSGNGGTLNITMILTAAANCTEIRVYCDDLNVGITASNISIQFSSDNTTWGDPGNLRSFSDSGSNISINDTLWTTGNGCYGSNPFNGTGITDGTFYIYARFKLVIPSGISNGTYSQSDWKIWFKIVS